MNKLTNAFLVVKEVDLDMTKIGGTGPQMSAATVSDYFTAFRFGFF